MARLLLIVVVVWLLWLWLKPDPRPAPPKQAKPADGKPPQTQMLSCAHCGVYLPASDALLDPAQHAYCCQAHRNAGPAP